MDTNSLVIYKYRPARITSSGDKIEIETAEGKRIKVRAKDILLIHPGPAPNPAGLERLEGDVESAWELLQGEECTLKDIAELAFEECTPAAAWSAWLELDDGLYFSGSPDKATARTLNEVTATKAARVAKAAQELEWTDFVERVSAQTITPEDRPRVAEVEEVANGRRNTSRLLKALKRSATPENAHALLLGLGVWDETINPYPQRIGVVLQSPQAECTGVSQEARKDLTHLAAYAIDDEDAADPDDAISIDGGRIWVHVADAAALAPPDSALDIAARAAGATLYLPERTVTMLPPAATPILGLGLNEVSPALSFGFAVAEDGSATDVEITPSLIKARRLSYARAEERLAEEPFCSLLALCDRFRARRRRNGAALISLPEAKVRVVDGEVVIKSLPEYRSRQLVAEAMLMAGEAAGRFALERDIPFPYATQAPPDTPEEPNDLAAAFAYRKRFKRTQMKSAPEPHAGLGIDVYARATSPMRRYLDLVAHQQLRAYLNGSALLDEQELLERVGAAEAVAGSVRTAERMSNRHWTIVYLRRNPDWQGSGIIVDKRESRGIAAIPDLGIDAPVQLTPAVELNAEVRLCVSSLFLPELTMHFRIQG